MGTICFWIFSSQRILIKFISVIHSEWTQNTSFILTFGNELLICRSDHIIADVFFHFTLDGIAAISGTSQSLRQISSALEVVVLDVKFHLIRFIIMSIVMIRGVGNESRGKLKEKGRINGKRGRRNNGRRLKNKM